MPAAREETPLERLRLAVAARVEARSLRQVARDVGMSPTGLQKFLAGSRPYSATRRKLERWYVRESAHYGGELGAGSALAALRVLVQDWPARRQAGVIAKLLDALEQAHGEERRSAPPWLLEVRELLRREGPAGPG
ncbi:MAG: hypothetical protein HY703_07645 [Gemmatimonadetes bacterium]|nr:hypothetical protein [Gemmatimonadota bacterium]